MTQSWKCNHQGTYKDGAGGKVSPVTARGELGTAGWKSIQLTPLTAWCNGIHYLIFILGVSHTPVTSLPWLFCELFTLQGQDVLPPNPFYFRGLAEGEAACWLCQQMSCAEQGHTTKQFLPKPVWSPLVGVYQEVQEQMCFLHCAIKAVVAAPSDCCVSTGS